MHSQMVHHPVQYIHGYHRPASTIAGHDKEVDVLVSD
jgi:hypothetical protein